MVQNISFQNSRQPQGAYLGLSLAKGSPATYVTRDLGEISFNCTSIVFIYSYENNIKHKYSMQEKLHEL
jgi:hypothetical protein